LYFKKLIVAAQSSLDFLLRVSGNFLAAIPGFRDSGGIQNYWNNTEVRCVETNVSAGFSSALTARRNSGLGRAQY
jgi:hypothetical protein